MQANAFCFDGDPALGQRAGHFEKTVGERGLAMVDVRDDAEIPYELRVHFFRLPIFSIAGRIRMARAIFRRACCIRTSDTRGAKTVPYKRPVCHNSQAPSACRAIVGERKSCLTRVELCERSLVLQGQRLYLTGELSRHRVSAILTRLRPATPADETLQSGQTPVEVIVTNEADTAVMPDEAKLLHKLRMRIIPFVFLLYVISFLDRINIGFAALTMNKELAISSKQFGLVAGIFFFGYFLFEIPSNLLLHRIGARIWIARILITWGILAMVTGLVHSVQQLYLVRFLLGLAEAGYFPGIVLYLTYWFRQREQAQMIALFLTGIPVTSILGAPVSGFILDHVHWLSLGSWRWLLILEGIPAVVCGVLTYFLLPSRPAEAKFLGQEEKEWIAAELAREEGEKLASHSISAGKALLIGRIWHLALIGFTVNNGMYMLNFWMPQLVKSLTSGISNSLIGLLVMIPHLVGLPVMVLVSRSSDRKQERRYHAAIPAIAAGIALASLGATHSIFPTILLLAVAAMGIYSVYGPFYSLPGDFLTGFAAASGIALVSSVANLGGFAGPYAIGWISQKTGSLYGGLAVAGVSLFASATLMMFLPRRLRGNASESG